MLLTHEVEDISGVVTHCNMKVESQVVTWTLTTINLLFGKRNNELTVINYEHAYA